MDFIVGTFNTSHLFTLRFSPTTPNSHASLTIVKAHSAIGNHSWLALSPLNPSSGQDRLLYATAWTEPPSIAAYSIDSSTGDVRFINAKPVSSRSGYVCASDTHVYSVGGPTGEAFALQPDGSIGELVQELHFVDDHESVSDPSQPAQVPHGDFGGLRHGAHSVDLSPDGRSLYVADIGRNAVWTYSINRTRSAEPHLVLGGKHCAPRAHDAPRHTWPHPSGRVLYSLQEHSSMVDLFDVAEDGVTLTHVQGVKVIPADKDCRDYWADEVRVSTLPVRSKGAGPQYLYASTRGLRRETKGYVAVYALEEDGALSSTDAVCIWETPTSGGIANAIEPAPWRREFDGAEYLAMTDSEEGWVFLLAFDGKAVREVARVNLGKTGKGEVVQAATAIWIDD